MRWKKKCLSYLFFLNSLWKKFFHLKIDTKWSSSPKLISHFVLYYLMYHEIPCKRDLERNTFSIICYGMESDSASLTRSFSWDIFYERKLVMRALEENLIRFLTAEMWGISQDLDKFVGGESFKCTLFIDKFSSWEMSLFRFKT